MTVEQYKDKIDAYMKDYLQERLDKVKNYEKRLERHNRTVYNQKWQMRIIPKDKKETNKLLSVSFEKTKEPYVKSFLLLDSGQSSTSNINCYDLKSFMDLKKNAKRTYNKLLHDCLILAPVQKSALIMKSLAKTVSKYNKSIVFVPEKTMQLDPSSIIKDYENRCFLKIDKDGLINMRIGILREDTSDVMKRINNVMQLLVNNEYTIKDLYLKPNFGKPLKLND